MPSFATPRYSTVAIVLHWLIAFALLFQLGLGWRMDGPRSPESFAIFQLHKSVGITILLLTLVRIGWRLSHRPPPMPRLAGWEHLLARATHAGFYLILLGLPLTGWIMVSASKLQIPTLLYGVIPWPEIPGLRGASREMWDDVGHEGHELLVYGALLLFVMHVAGALKHQLFSRDEPILGRMAPGAKPGRRLEPRLFAILALAAGALAAGRAGPLPSFGAAQPPAPAETPAPAAEAPATAPAPAVAAAPVPEAPPAPAAEPAPVEPSRWAVAKGSTLDFEASWGGSAIKGRFERWTADVLFAPEALDKSRVRVEIDMTSAVTGDPQQESALPSAEWFDAAAHPKAVFVAQRFEKTGEDRYVARGRLTLRGVSRPVALPFRLQIDDDRARVRGVTSLDRTAFGVGQGEWQSTDQIAGKVSVAVDLRATRR